MYEDNIPFLASALTFSALLAAIPFFLLVLAGMGYLIRSRIPTGEIDLHLLLEGFIPIREGSAAPDPFGRVEGMVEDIVASRGQLSLVGVPAFLWFATRLFAGVRAGLNEVFDTEETRSFFVGKAVDAGLVLLTGALLVVNASLSFWIGLLEVQGTGGFAMRFIGAAAGFLSAAVLFFVVYKLAPARQIPWDTAWVAAAFSALAFELAKRGYGLYLQSAVGPEQLSANATIGAIILFVIWVYYTSFVFLLGGEVAETYELRKRQRQRRATLG